jgi:hypothetical protein
MATTAALAPGFLASAGPAIAIIGILALAVVVLELAGMWQVYTKAHEHGWAVLVPFYNTWVLLRIVGRPGWWLVLAFIPFVNLVVSLILLWELAKSFNKTAGWFWGLLLLPFIFYPVLGFGASQYAGPAGPEKWVAKAG